MFWRLMSGRVLQAMRARAVADSSRNHPKPLKALNCLADQINHADFILVNSTTTVTSTKLCLFLLFYSRFSLIVWSCVSHNDSGGEA